MKKIRKYNKEYLINYALKKHLKELKRNEKRRRLKYGTISQKVKKRRAKKFIKDTNSVVHENCLAPDNFSLLHNTEEVIKYFLDAKKTLHNNIPVFFDLSSVKEMGPETLLYLCATVNDKIYTAETALKGNAPSNGELKQLFVRAGFFNFVVPESNQQKYTEDIYGEIIHKITRKKVEAELAGKVCESAIEHTFGKNPQKNMSVLPILIECMSNTREHANYGKGYDIYNWWLLAYKDPSSKITRFCILDIGVGIFGSLERKYNDKTLSGKLLRTFQPNKNMDTLKKIFEGEQISVTKRKERGRGLNHIHNLVKNDINIKNFTLISNDVIAIIDKEKVSINKLENNFYGTLFYWELIP